MTVNKTEEKVNENIVLSAELLCQPFFWVLDTLGVWVYTIVAAGLKVKYYWMKEA